EPSFGRDPRRAVSIGIQAADKSFAQSVCGSVLRADAAIPELGDAAVEESNQQTAAPGIHHEHGGEVSTPKHGPLEGCALTLRAHSPEAQDLIGKPQIRLRILDHRADTACLHVRHRVKAVVLQIPEGLQCSDPDSSLLVLEDRVDAARWKSTHDD